LGPEGRSHAYPTDAAGDRLHTVVQASAEQETSWQREGRYVATVYRFDQAGNLVRRTGPDGDTRFTWDAHQRLIATTTGTATTVYHYDPLGRRIFKQTGESVTHFCWDGDLLLGDAIVSGARQLVREWVPYPDTYEPLAQVHLAKAQDRENAPTSLVYYCHNEPSGCPTRLLDSAGNAVWAARYAGWGQIEPLLSDGIDNPIRLQGQYEDRETGLYYNRYRYYDSNAGLYISQDPIGLLGGLQLYISVPNVLSWSDPLGLND